MSVRDDAGDVGIEFGDEGEQATGGGVFRLRSGADREPDEGAVTPVAEDRVPDEVELFHVFVGDHVPPVLVPVDDDLPLGPFREYIQVGVDFALSRVVHGNGDDFVPDRVEPAPGVAVPRGMGNRAFLLVPVIPDVEPDGVLPPGEAAHQVFVDPEILQYLGRECLVGTLPPIERCRDGG